MNMDALGTCMPKTRGLTTIKQLRAVLSGDEYLIAGLYGIFEGALYFSR